MPQVRFSVFPKIYFGASKINQSGWIEASGQRLVSVDQTHLVLPKGFFFLFPSALAPSNFKTAGSLKKFIWGDYFPQLDSNLWRQDTKCERYRCALSKKHKDQYNKRGLDKKKENPTGNHKFSN